MIPAKQSALLIHLELLVMFLISGTLVAQDSVWVRGVTARASMETRSLQEARALAIQHARDEAVKRAFGTSIASSFMVQQSELIKNGKVEAANDDAVKFILESADAKVLRERVISERPENTARDETEPRYDYVVIIDAFVVRERGNRDPDFRLMVDGVRPSYEAGEKLIIEVKATRWSYLNVFSFGSDGLVYHVFPNAYDSDNLLHERVSRIVPGTSVYSLTMALPEGKQAASETILLVATKDSLVFKLGDMHKPGVEFAEIRRALLQQLMEWLVQIPRDRRVEIAETYVIRAY